MTAAVLNGARDSNNKDFSCCKSCLQKCLKNVFFFFFINSLLSNKETQSTQFVPLIFAAVGSWEQSGTEWLEYRVKGEETLRGRGRRRLEPAPLLKVKKLNKAEIWVQLAVMEVGQNGEEMGKKVGSQEEDKLFWCTGCYTDVHLAQIAWFCDILVIQAAQQWPQSPSLWS